jgi:hypothetical protein
VALAGGSAFCFLVVRVFLAADQQRVRSRWSRDVLRLGAYDRCNAQLEILKRFDSALFVHCATHPQKNKRLTNRSSKLSRRIECVRSLARNAHRGNYADDVHGATALGCREGELRDLIAVVRA